MYHRTRNRGPLVTRFPLRPQDDGVRHPHSLATIRSCVRIAEQFDARLTWR